MLPSFVARGGGHHDGHGGSDYESAGEDSDHDWELDGLSCDNATASALASLGVA